MHLLDNLHIKVPTSILPVLAEENKHSNNPRCPQEYKMTQSKLSHTTLMLSFKIV